MKKYVAYYRVSTDKQGKSGLGLDAQKTCVEGRVSDGELVAEFTEVESGRNKNRTELAKAIATAKAAGATLIVAKLDRLARDVAFLFNLRDSGVDFIACDLPDFNTLTLGVFASFAQFEAERISQRTKDALAEKKKQGVKLGIKGAENLIKGNATEKAVIATKEKAAANENTNRARAFAKSLKQNGLTNSQISRELNNNGYKTAKGCEFIPKQVERLLTKAEITE